MNDEGRISNALRRRAFRPGSLRYSHLRSMHVHHGTHGCLQPGGWGMRQLAEGLRYVGLSISATNAVSTNVCGYNAD
jgi:hypothetical protein